MKERTNYVAKATKAYGGERFVPGWIMELAREANRTSAKDAAKRIGYSGAVLSHLFANNYPGDVAKVEAKVRGALMGETVICPVVGEIGRDRCLDEQKMGNTGASAIRAKLYRQCRGIGIARCPHSRLGRQEDA